MPNGYKIVRQSFFDDLQGEKRTCWDIEILQDDEKDMPMKSADVCILTPVKNMGIRSFTRCSVRMTGMHTGY